MLKNLKKKSQGFTIIEVLIVLAIAGLIMLIVFLAVPALQRNNRNTQRKNDVQGALGAMTEYSSNNGGALPADGAGSTLSIKSSYFDSAADVSIVSTVPATPDANKLYIIKGAKCAAGVATNTGASSRNIAAVYSLETSGGAFTSTCQES